MSRSLGRSLSSWLLVGGMLSVRRKSGIGVGEGCWMITSGVAEVDILEPGLEEREPTEVV